MNNDIREAAEWVRHSERLLVFTGAGISAESGIPTFRDDDGFWREFPPERFATWDGLFKTALHQPRAFAEFVHAVIAPIAAAEPNAAHRAIADAERHVDVTVVTQNIDRLHWEAGTTTTHEVHGSMFEIVDRRRRFRRYVSRQQLRRVATAIERASRGLLTLPRVMWAVRRIAGIGVRGIHFPNLVLFGDALAEPAWSASRRAAEQVDCVIQVGCSGMVYPAATLPEIARAQGATVIDVDPHSGQGDIWLRGTATQIVPELMNTAFAPR
ncbi:MAG: iron dicitrate transport regulator FecR [Planctomycetales bacterium]|nr:iron dicitrate transport regulator FecR [Planctomycetales bacterium]